MLTAAVNSETTESPGWVPSTSAWIAAAVSAALISARAAATITAARASTRWAAAGSWHSARKRQIRTAEPARSASTPSPTPNTATLPSIRPTVIERAPEIAPKATDRQTSGSSIPVTGTSSSSGSAMTRRACAIWKGCDGVTGSSAGSAGPSMSGGGRWLMACVDAGRAVRRVRSRRARSLPGSARRW